MMENSNFYISKLKVRNFKNFQNLEVDLDRFNVIIGPNASGKSNFKSIFSFFIDIVDKGLQDALSIHGGREYILNFNANEPLLSIEAHFLSDSNETIVPNINNFPKLETRKIIYKFCIKFTQSRNYTITDDQLISFIDSINGSNENTCELAISKSGEKINIVSNLPDEIKTKVQDRFNTFKNNFILDKNDLLIEEPSLRFILPIWSRFINSISVYDFDPKKIKDPSNISQSFQLSYDGSNLSYILDKIKKDNKNFKKLMNYLQELLPFLKTISTEYHNGMMEFNLQEIYGAKNVSALFASDGTVNIIALLISLFLEDNRLSVIEEPERNIHPGLLNTLIDIMDDASEVNQIIITTHNLTVLEHVSEDQILMISRDDEGNSYLIKPRDHEQLKKFSSKMSMQILLKQNLLS